jgi:hypothetical protein
MAPLSLAELLQFRENARVRLWVTMRMLQLTRWSESGTSVAWTSTGCVATAKFRFRLSASENLPAATTTLFCIASHSHRTHPSLQVEGLFLLASARNAAPISESSAIAASLPSRVISHLGLDIPVVQRAHWARGIISAAVTHAYDAAAARMPQVRSGLSSSVHVLGCIRSYFRLSL